MFSRTVRPSVSGGSCWSIPTVASGSRMASPLDGWSSPAMILSREDLPVPLGPTTPILAPWRNDSVTLSSTTLSPWALRTLRSVKTYSAMIRQAYGACGGALAMAAALADRRGSGGGVTAPRVPEVALDSGALALVGHVAALDGH